MQYRRIARLATASYRHLPEDHKEVMRFWYTGKGGAVTLGANVGALALNSYLKKNTNLRWYTRWTLGSIVSNALPYLAFPAQTKEMLRISFAPEEVTKMVSSVATGTMKEVIDLLDSEEPEVQASGQGLERQGLEDFVGTYIEHYAEEFQCSIEEAEEYFREDFPTYAWLRPRVERREVTTPDEGSPAWVANCIDQYVEEFGCSTEVAEHFFRESWPQYAYMRPAPPPRVRPAGVPDPVVIQAEALAKGAAFAEDVYAKILEVERKELVHRNLDPTVDSHEWALKHRNRLMKTYSISDYDAEEIFRRLFPNWAWLLPERIDPGPNPEEEEEDYW